MDIICSLFWVLLELVFFYFFCEGFFVSTNSVKTKLIVFLVSWLLVFINSALVSNQMIKMGILYSILCFAMIVLYQGVWYQFLLIAVVGGLFNSLLDLIMLYGLCALLRVSLEEFSWMKLYYVSTVTLSKLLSILLAWIFHRIRKPVNNQKIERKWILLTLFFPLVSYAMLAVVFVSFQNGNDLSLGAVIFSGFLAIANIAIIYLIGIMEKSTRSAQENALLHQEMDIQRNSIKALERSYRDQRKATHEYRNQLQTIHDLLVAEKETEAKNYIEQLQGLQTTRILAVNSHHAIVDAVLNHKYQTAKENDIDFQIQINNLSTLSIATDELVVLLSNLLDNAIWN